MKRRVGDSVRAEVESRHLASIKTFFEKPSNDMG